MGTLKDIVLVLFSLVFYAWGEPVWVLLLIFTSVFDYFNGIFIDKRRGRKSAVLGVILSCAVNLSVLGVFKYSGMIVSGINSALDLQLAVPEFHLPIGISFYTFQSLTYVADVYRGKAKAQRSYFRYLMYLSMFFQLVAGPIVRYSTVAREIESRTVRLSEFSDGISRLITGLGKKVLIANSVGQLADELLGFESAPMSVLAAWAGVILFSLQIYYDFSGYSDMAIGLGLMCGFHFPENFDYPYISRSATEFWRRWHISLGSFFRDYVYIPLGGNRRHRIFNIAVVWFCTGLWHGASVNFILWGLYFGVLLVIEKAFLLDLLEDLPKIFGHIYLILAVIFGWMIFYFTDLTKIAGCFGAMIGADGISGTDILTESKLKGSLWLIAAALILCAPVYKSLSRWGERVGKATKGGFIAVSTVKTVFLGLVLFASSVSLVGDTFNPFLYFRF
ncbi:MAG: MBOAT family protein [Ruminococcus sp.]|nr:MBOAT family protein [Ruminococcus sp.]